MALRIAESLDLWIAYPPKPVSLFGMYTVYIDTALCAR